jgi:hypothetical protein
VRAEVENFEIAALVFAPEGVNTYPTEGCPRRKRHDFVEPLFAIGVSFKLGKGAHDTLHVNRANQRATQSVAQSEISSPNLPNLPKLLKLPNLLSRANPYARPGEEGCPSKDGRTWKLASQ